MKETNKWSVRDVITTPPGMLSAFLSRLRLLGRFICGFLCPFGWFQELLRKIPIKEALHLEARRPADGGRAERGVLSIVLQVALPAGCVLCAAQ